MTKTVRSRANIPVDGILEGKWRVVARRVIAEPTPRTPFQPPRMGIYDYDVVPYDGREIAPPSSPSEGRRGEPLVSFRKIGS